MVTVADHILDLDFGPGMPSWIRRMMSWAAIAWCIPLLAALFM